VLFLSGLLHAERQRLGTRTGRRSLGCFKQAILVLRWAARRGPGSPNSPSDNQVSRSTGYTYLHEGITVLAAHAPSLHSVLLAAKMAGYAPRHHRRHPDRDRPLPYPRTDTGGGSVVVGKTRQPRREHPGHHRPGRLAAVDLTGTDPAANTTPPRCAKHGEILPLLTTWDRRRTAGCSAIWVTKGGGRHDHRGVQEAEETPPAPTCSSSSTAPTTRSAPSGNAGNSLLKTTFQKRCATSASVPGASAGSPQQPS